MTPDELLYQLERFGDAYAAARIEQTDASDAREADAKRPIVEAFELLTAHSRDLNTIGFAAATALGLVPPGTGEILGDPVELVEMLIKQRNETNARDLSWLSKTHWDALRTSAHLWGWGALYPEEKALSGTAARISPQDCDRIVDASLIKVREMLQGWSDDGRYHHCRVCGERGPLRHEGSSYVCGECNASEVER